MVATQLYDDDADRMRHHSVIESLARDLHQPLDEVQRQYEAALEEIKAGARVKDYLVVFAVRRIRELFRRAPAGSA
jgi:hypothetical protein